MEYLQKVKCKAKLKRKYKFLQLPEWTSGRHTKTWVRQPIEFDGIIIGKRTLSNGTVQYEESAYFEPDEYIVAYLVSFSMSRNPVYVLPEDIEK